MKVHREGALTVIYNSLTFPFRNSSSILKSIVIDGLGLAMWTEEVLTINLLKTERGLGFSILDYQDPTDPSNTVIVIRNNSNTIIQCIDDTR